MDSEFRHWVNLTRPPMVKFNKISGQAPTFSFLSLRFGVLAGAGLRVWSLGICCRLYSLKLEPDTLNTVWPAVRGCSLDQ